MVDFAVRAWDDKGPIGSGTHTRAIVNNQRFLDKCQASSMAEHQATPKKQDGRKIPPVLFFCCNLQNRGMM